MNPIFPDGNIPDTVLGPVMAKLVDLIGEKLGGRLLEIRHVDSVLVLSLSLENDTILWSHIALSIIVSIAYMWTNYCLLDSLSAHLLFSSL